MINNARRQHRGNRRPGRMARDSSALGTLSPARFSAFVSVSHQPPSHPPSLPHPVSAERVDIDRRDLSRANPISRSRVVRDGIRRGQHTETCRRTRECEGGGGSGDNLNPMCGTESAGQEPAVESFVTGGF